MSPELRTMGEVNMIGLINNGLRQPPLTVEICKMEEVFFTRTGVRENFEWLKRSRISRS